MLLLSPTQSVQAVHWFLPEQPGRLTGMHLLKTGNGALFADRWPDPTVLLAQSAGSYVLLGVPDALTEADLQRHIRGSVFAGAALVPLLQAAFPQARAVEKAVFCLSQALSAPEPLPDTSIRQLTSTDAHHLWGLSPPSAWITRSWGGPAGLAGSGCAWGAFRDGRLVSVSCSYYVGEQFEDVAIATEPEARGAGLGTVCAAAACTGILARGRRPIWNAALDHPASLHMAQKLGFAHVNTYRLYYC